MSQIQKEPDWTVNYYTELDPERRQVILNEHIMEPLTEADGYRKHYGLHDMENEDRIRMSLLDIL